MKALNTILLIDDNERDNFYHRMFLKEHRLARRIKIVPSANAALEHLKDFKELPPDLIVVNLDLPNRDAFRFVRKYSRLDADQKAPSLIAFLSDSLDQRDRQKAESHPQISACVKKPLTQEVLDRLIPDDIVH